MVCVQRIFIDCALLTTTLGQKFRLVNDCAQGIARMGRSFKSESNQSSIIYQDGKGIGEPFLEAEFIVKFINLFV